MYDVAVEDCLYHPTCEKCFYRRFGKHRESEDLSPLNCVSRNLLLKLGLALKI